jgi:hypothetical protein
MSPFRTLAAIAAGVVAVLSTSSSNALTVINVGVVDTITATVNGEETYATPLIFNHTLYGWCITPFRDIYAGRSDYTFNPITFDVANSPSIVGAALSQTQIDEVDALVQRGSSELADDASPTTLAANALAIWSDEGASVSGVRGQLLTDLLADIEWSKTHDATVPIEVIADSNFATQSLAYSSAVPEPFSWALVMFGLAVVGGTLRSDRGRTAGQFRRSKLGR